LKDGSSYADLGCMVYNENTRQFSFFAQKGLNYDECQIDKSGRWLVIKEKTGIDPRSEVDDRIIDLQTGNERVLLDRNGAGGHSDNGFGYMVAADNMNPQPGAVRVWRFDLDVTGGEPLANVSNQGTLVYQTTDCARDERQARWRGDADPNARSEPGPSAGSDAGPDASAHARSDSRSDAGAAGRRRVVHGPAGCLDEPGERGGERQQPHQDGGMRRL